MLLIIKDFWGPDLYSCMAILVTITTRYLHLDTRRKSTGSLISFLKFWRSLSCGYTDYHHNKAFTLVYQTEANDIISGSLKDKSPTRLIFLGHIPFLVQIAVTRLKTFKRGNAIESFFCCCCCVHILIDESNSNALRTLYFSS